MIRISQLKLPPDHTEGELEEAVRKKLRLPKESRIGIKIRRRSVDARKRPRIYYVYTLDVETEGEKRILKRFVKDSQVCAARDALWRFPTALRQGEIGDKDREGRRNLQMPPVIVGSGPAGLFCAYALAKAGFSPMVIERGENVASRTETVRSFWEGRSALDPESNVQFGEGGAGTFSDGKLNTGIADPEGRIRAVLETFAAFGADPEILYSYKPHIGTDVLKEVTRRMRQEIIRLGGSFRFGTRLDDIAPLGDGAYELTLSCRDRSLEDPSPRVFMKQKAQAVILAVGHSARDTFAMLCKRGFPMEEKAFAVGVRVVHPQKMINDAMYGEDCPYEMDAAPYKLTARSGEKGIYSFCMCPGGYVVNASSEPGHLAVNGMSLHSRSSGYANSAIVVTVTPEDCRRYLEEERAFPEENLPGGRLFDGIRFQRMLEKKAYDCGGGKIPVQRFEDFSGGKGEEGPADGLWDAFKGSCAFARADRVYPAQIRDLVTEGMHRFASNIPGFDGKEVLIAAAESRTSSPVRILRGPDMCCTAFPGIYPCGEGAGYAGGITSAAVDGLRAAQAVAQDFILDFPVE